MNSGESVFTFGKILSGVNRTLGIANQVIPLYQQTKPLFRNAKTAYNILKNRRPIKNITKSGEEVNGSLVQEKKTINNSPKFFI